MKIIDVPESIVAFTLNDNDELFYLDSLTYEIKGLNGYLRYLSGSPSLMNRPVQLHCYGDDEFFVSGFNFSYSVSKINEWYTTMRNNFMVKADNNLINFPSHIGVNPYRSILPMSEKLEESIKKLLNISLSFRVISQDGTPFVINNNNNINKIYIEDDELKVTHYESYFISYNHQFSIDHACDQLFSVYSSSKLCILTKHSLKNRISKHISDRMLLNMRLSPDAGKGVLWSKNKLHFFDTKTLENTYEFFLDDHIKIKNVRFTSDSSMLYVMTENQLLVLDVD